MHLLIYEYLPVEAISWYAQNIRYTLSLSANRLCKVMDNTFLAKTLSVSKLTYKGVSVNNNMKEIENSAKGNRLEITWDNNWDLSSRSQRLEASRPHGNAAHTVSGVV